MKWWEAYKHLVERNTLGSSTHEFKGLSFWRDQLFTNIILYLLPVSFLALVPGIIMSFVGRIPLLALYDTLVVGCFAAIALYPALTISFRKVALIVCLYLLSIILLVYLGSFGPGLLYLLALTVFTALIFPASIAIWSVVGNVAICVFFSFLIHFKLLDVALVRLYSLGSWIAVSSNLVILSAVILVSINLLFNGLQATIVKEAELQKQLRQESQSLERMLERMEIKNAELEQFAYIASHDLQEPLRTISSVVDTFENQYKDKLDVHALTYLSFLTQSSAHMQALITGLLEYSRIGKETEIEFINCNTILEEVIFELTQIITENHAAVRIDKLPSIYAYRLELKELFKNLISNAIKFRKQEMPPEINIQVREEKDQYTFSVQDNGIGIEEKFKQKVFVIFQRLHTKSKYAGTGIGLAQCKKIAELHGGKIWVDSKLRQGSTFYFTISKNYTSHGNKIKEHSAY
jgi:signal transduction histidine kinase